MVTLKPGWRRRNRKDNWKRKIELTGGIIRPKSAGGSEEGGSDGSWKKNDQGGKFVDGGMRKKGKKQSEGREAVKMSRWSN